MPSEQAAERATKLTVEQLEHLTMHHFLFRLLNDRLELDYVCRCGKKNCPVPKTVTVQICQKRPCGGIIH